MYETLKNELHSANRSWGVNAKKLFSAQEVIDATNFVKKFQPDFHHYHYQTTNLNKFHKYFKINASHKKVIEKQCEKNFPE